MAPIAHWDEVEPARLAIHGVAATWLDLGRATGSRRIGVARVRIDPGERPTPAHRHGAEEELFYVLAGDGLSWQDGATYRVRAGDCLVHRANAEAHTLVAGPDGLDVLAFGERVPVEACLVVRAGVAWLGPTWVAAGGDHPWAQDAAVGPMEIPEPQPTRPDRIVHLDDVRDTGHERGEHRAEVRNLGKAVGAVRTGLRHQRIRPGALGMPLHCHSAEEELFIVLDGEGTLLLGDEEHPVGRGHVVSRLPGTRVAHAFRGGPEGLVLLAYGTREPNDISYYPRSGKVAIRGVGVIGRIEQVPFWDGEA